MTNCIISDYYIVISMLQLMNHSNQRYMKDKKIITNC